MILDEMDVAIKNAANAKVVEGTDENKAFSVKIGMTDEERYKELVDQKLIAQQYDKEKMPKDREELNVLMTNVTKLAKPAIKKLAKKIPH